MEMKTEKGVREEGKKKEKEGMKMNFQNLQ